jgi:hypothetical protein
VTHITYVLVIVAVESTAIERARIRHVCGWVGGRKSAEDIGVACAILGKVAVKGFSGIRSGACESRLYDFSKGEKMRKEMSR